ncbi:MAG TPA: replication initiator protein A, partial [Rhizomicrobium sp.]
GRQEGGWSFDFVHLHAKSGSLSPLKHFAYDLREIVRRQTLPGYRLRITHDTYKGERLLFTPLPINPLAQTLHRFRGALVPGDRL